MSLSPFLTAVKAGLSAPCLPAAPHKAPLKKSQEGVGWDGSTLPPPHDSGDLCPLRHTLSQVAILGDSATELTKLQLPGCTCSPKACLCAFAHTLCIQKPGPSVYHNLTFVLQIQRPCVAFPDPPRPVNPCRAGSAELCDLMAHPAHYSEPCAEMLQFPCWAHPPPHKPQANTR